MSEAVQTALITGSFSAFVAVVSIILSSRLTLYRIKMLEDKVSKHNNLVERMVVVEQSSKSAHRRLDAITGKMEGRG